MSVISVKVPPKIKEEMERLKNRIKWAEEIRRFIFDKLEQEHRKQNIQHVEKLLEGVRRHPKGTAARLIREDRDSHR